MSSQETKKEEWPLRSDLPCHNCGYTYSYPPCAIITPRNRHGAYGLFNRYCSWNCAKRGLLGLRNRPWFSSLSLIAKRSGATFPIKASETGKPPLPHEKQIIRFLPTLSPLQLQPVVQIPYIAIIVETTSSPENGIEEEEEEPIVFESVSYI